jgi:hypothetical protein
MKLRGENDVAVIDRTKWQTLARTTSLATVIDPEKYRQLLTITDNLLKLPDDANRSAVVNQWLQQLLHLTGIVDQQSLSERRITIRNHPAKNNQPAETIANCLPTLQNTQGNAQGNERQLILRATYTTNVDVEQFLSPASATLPEAKQMASWIMAIVTHELIHVGVQEAHLQNLAEKFGFKPIPINAAGFLAALKNAQKICNHLVTLNTIPAAHALDEAYVQLSVARLMNYFGLSINSPSPQHPKAISYGNIGPNAVRNAFHFIQAAQYIDMNQVDAGMQVIAATMNLAFAPLPEPPPTKIETLLQQRALIFKQFSKLQIEEFLF